MEIIGELYIPNDTGECIQIFQSDINTTNNDRHELMKEFSIWLNSPWWEENIYINTTQIETDTWECEYMVIGYDGITSILYFKSNTAESAISGCKTLLNSIQQKFNPNNISI